MLPIFLLGFLLRVFKLGDQSLWADEGYGVYLGTESLQDLSRDIFVDLNHVPLYFFALHFWIRLTGASEFSIRFLSLIGGLLTLALTYRLAKVGFGRKLGLAAAALSAIAPFQVYYSQEARMHIWTAVWVLLAANGLLNALRSPRRWTGWITYAAAACLTLYTFYFGGFALAGLTIAAAVTLLARRSPISTYVRLAAANFVAIASFLPWAAIAAVALYQQAEHKGKDFVVYGLYDFFNLIWKTYLAGITVETDHLPWPIWPALALLLLGGLYLRRNSAAVLLYGFLVVPLLSVFLLNLRFPHFLPRYLLFASPPFYILVGAGLLAPFMLAGWRRYAAFVLGVTGLVFFAATTSQSLFNNYFNPAFARDDYRGVARAIAGAEQPDDAIILNAPWQIYNFPYYYKGDVDIVGIPHEDPLEPAITDPKLADLVSSRAGIWLVLYGNASMDPAGHVEQWLDEHSYKVNDAWYGTIRLARYINPVSGSSRPGIARLPVNQIIADGIRLTGYELPASGATAGEELPVRLLWEATARPASDYRVSLRIVDAGERIWSQSDSEPLEGAVPTSQWSRGEAYRDPRRLDLEGGTPPGTYRLQAVAYGGETDRQGLIEIGSVEVRPDTSRNRPNPSLTFAVSSDRQKQTGILGIDLSTEDFVPGSVLQAKLALRGSGSTVEPVHLELLSGDRVVARGPELLTGALDAGELRREFAELRLPADLPDGKYRLRIAMPSAAVDTAELLVKGRSRRYDVPTGLHEVHLPAAPGIEIAAFSIPESLVTPAGISIAWRALESQQDDLIAFVHVVNSTDQIVAQSDLPPGRAEAPTGSWLKNEIVLDERRLTLSNIAPGTYRVYAGLYRQSDGKRVGPGDGRILLGTALVR